ncbi:MAG: HAD family hydrolase [Rhodobacteraceae bacterium]|jgi:phosphoglycolate phosphatase|nr:HAD family hydrolase [Paracoccaceae bacterium]
MPPLPVPPPVAGVLFDKDGTLFDFTASWAAWVAALVADLAGGAPGSADRLSQAIGFDRRTRRFAPDSPVIACTAEEIAGRMLPHLPQWQLDALVAEMNARAARVQMVPAAPLPPLLAGLRDAGLRLGLVTNDAEVAAASHLAAHGIDDAFDFVAGYDSGFGAKPAPGMLLAFADRFGLDPAAVLMVGDSRHDLIAARAAGMPAVGVLTGTAAAEDLAPLALAVLPDIGHLPGWLRRGAAA